MGDAAQLAQEAVGSHYDSAMMIEARRRTFEAVEAIAARVAPGMIEEAAVEMAQGVLKDLGLLRGWHRVYIRFGPNTLKNYDEPSEPGVVLGEQDIFFVDIGPVWDKWEGDGGDTFVFGDDPEMHRARRDVRVLYDRVRDHWRGGTVSGQALYAFAAAEAERMDWRLNLGLAGHRLSDFPHKAIHQGTLGAAPYAPSAGLWVLEMHIRHPTRPIGAFYEDLLLDAAP
jgi:methionyl aminopeptidase